MKSTAKHAKELAKWLKDRNLVLQADRYIELVSTLLVEDGYALLDDSTFIAQFPKQ